VSLPPLSASTLITEAALDPAGATLLVVSSLGYAVGVRRLAARGRPWPVGRGLAFAGAMVLLAVATQSGLAAYDTVQFSAHMVQHLLLGLAVPILFVASRPLTLALQAGSRPTQVSLLRALHHPVARLLGHPLVSAGLFASTLWVLYFTPLYALSATNDLVHVALHLHFVAVGVLFYGAVLAGDPRPVEVPPAGRVGLAFLAVPLHAFVGIALITGTEVLGAAAHQDGRLAWQGDALADQRFGAGLLLVVGEVIGLVVVLAALMAWMRADLRAAAREDRALDLQAVGS
jgi:cytochrome c oxidase assembly factor CtaG